MENYKPTGACCSQPVIIGPSYESKGSFTEVLRLKTYVSGPEQASKAVFVIYDVFGYSSQILEGADKLAAAGYRVFMPDFWEGKPAPLDWMPMNSDYQDEKALDDFCEGPGETNKTVKKVIELQAGYQRLNPAITRWAAVGYCWGGWIVPFVVGDGTPFAACVQCHPGFAGVDVVEKVQAPLLSLCSKDEPESSFAEFKAALKVDNYFEVFKDQDHGWLSARADLSKPRVRQAFDRGYRMMLDWFARYL